MKAWVFGVGRDQKVGVVQVEIPDDADNFEQNAQEAAEALGHEGPFVVADEAEAGAIRAWLPEVALAA